MNNPPPQATNEFKQQGYERRDVKGHTKRVRGCLRPRRSHRAAQMPADPSLDRVCACVVQICTLDWCSSGRKLATGERGCSWASA